VSKAILPAKRVGGYSTPSHNHELTETFLTIKIFSARKAVNTNMYSR